MTRKLASFDQRGGGDRQIRIEIQGDRVDWITYDEALELENQLGMALFLYEQAKYDAGIKGEN